MFSRLLGRWRGATVTVVSLFLYAALVGEGPAVLRAVVMGGLGT